MTATLSVLTPSHVARREQAAYRLAARFIGKTFSYTNENGCPVSVRCIPKSDAQFVNGEWAWETVQNGAERTIYSPRNVWLLRGTLGAEYVQRIINGQYLSV